MPNNGADLRLVTVLITRLVASIRTLTASIETIVSANEHTAEAIREQTEAYKTSKEPQPSGHLEQISAIIDYSPEVIKRSQRDHDRSYGIQRATFWVGLITLIILAAYTASTFVLVKISGQALTQSERALDATLESARRDQRAWVGVDSLLGNIELGKSLIVTAQYRNSGRTPALKLMGIAALEPVDRGKEPSFTYDTNSTGVLSSTVLQPNGLYRIILNGGGAKAIVVTQVGYDRVRSGDLLVFIYGKLTYEDIFHRPHWTTFCMFLDPITGTWNSYKTYNGVDQEAEPTR